MALVTMLNWAVGVTQLTSATSVDPAPRRFLSQVVATASIRYLPSRLDMARQEQGPVAESSRGALWAYGLLGQDPVFLQTNS